MTHVEMIATGKFCYGGSNLKPGDVFWAETAHAKLLKIVRNAKDAEIEPAKAIEAVQKAKPEKKAPKAKATKRTYRRRDMSAK
jgi:hypothetical protein